MQNSRSSCSGSYKAVTLSLALLRSIFLKLLPGAIQAFPRGDSPNDTMENPNGSLKENGSIKAGWRRGWGKPFKCLFATWLSRYAIKMLKGRKD